MILPQTDRISVLVVDDESPARQRLADLLRKDTLVGLILEAENGVSALAQSRKDVRISFFWMFKCRNWMDSEFWMN
ncbi:hypothetical protein [Acidicapsa acidisoli]|uniref:hypothetical protein n=1 Tax=Acidicapsa acidisoli TaxID=1615681 RepID=UPI0021DFDE6F|nr:hypothetical protein [Acidicapsa acidisoli]